MSYRDDVVAAQARADAAEATAEAAERRVEELHQQLDAGRNVVRRVASETGRARVPATGTDELAAAQARATAAEVRAEAARRRAERLQHVLDARGKNTNEPVQLQLPGKIHVERNGRELVIRWPWYRTMHSAFIVYFLVGVGSSFAWADTRPNSNPPLIVCIAILTPLLWAGVAGFVNSTTVTVGDGWLSIVEGPLTWRRKLRVEQHEVTQLYVRRSSSEMKGETTWRVWVGLTGGRERELSGRLVDLDVAKYIEQELEIYLGIANTAVDDEAER